MTPVLVGHLDGRPNRPVYDMAAGGEGLTMRDLVRGEDVIASLGDWSDALETPRRSVKHRLAQGRPIWRALCDQPRQRMWDNGLPYLKDFGARRFVAEHPAGANLQEVADFWGLTREGVRLHEFVALQSFEAACPPSLRAVILESLRERHEAV